MNKNPQSHIILTSFPNFHDIIQDTHYAQCIWYLCSWPLSSRSFVFCIRPLISSLNHDMSHGTQFYFVKHTNSSNIHCCRTSSWVLSVRRLILGLGSFIFLPYKMIPALNPICVVKKLLMVPISNSKAKYLLERINAVVQRPH